LTGYRNTVTLRRNISLARGRPLSDEIKATAIKFFAEQDRLQGGPADELCANGYKARLASLPTMDLAGHKEFAAAFYAGFPDLRHSISDVLAEGDRVAVRFQLKGTNTERFMGNPPTGKTIKVDALAFMSVASGTVTELYGQFDQLGLWQQIGVVPEGAPAG
jgi:predicted ester cyclase